MSDDDATVQCWMVDRTYTDKGLVTIVYATPDGERAVQSQKSTEAIVRNPVTAAREVPEANLTAVDDPETRERYRTEVERTSSNHAPDDEI